MKRLIYVNIDEPLVIINPEFTFMSRETFTLWDDCMSFPNLLVQVNRHQKITMIYRDEHWQEQKIAATDAFAELLQHEHDHLDGILATMRAIDDKSFKLKARS